MGTQHTRNIKLPGPPNPRSWFRPADDVADAIIADAVADGWNVVSHDAPASCSPWLRLRRGGIERLVSYDWRMVGLAQVDAYPHSCPYLEQTADYRIPSGLMTPDELAVERRGNAQADAEAIENLANIGAEYDGQELTGFLWFSCPAHLRGRVDERSREIRNQA